jgi:hypothetical protein
VRATNAQIILIQFWDRNTDQVKTIYQKIQSMDGLENLDMLDKPFAPTDYLKVAQYLRDRRNISLRVNDDELDPLLRARMRDSGLLWVVEVPIVARDEVLGLVRLGDTRFDRNLSDSEVQLIETLINQAAVAMSNARLYDQILKFTQELEVCVEEARTNWLAPTRPELERDRWRHCSASPRNVYQPRPGSRAEPRVGWWSLLLVTHGSILLVDPQTDALMARGAGRRTHSQRQTHAVQAR